MYKCTPTEISDLSKKVCAIQGCLCLLQLKAEFIPVYIFVYIERFIVNLSEFLMCSGNPCFAGVSNICGCNKLCLCL